MVGLWNWFILWFEKLKEIGDCRFDEEFYQSPITLFIDLDGLKIFIFYI